MSIQSEINRIAGAKSDIADAIEDKDVTVPSGTKLDGMANLIRQISGGSDKLNSTQAADAYDPTVTYAVGDKVSYAGNVYSCISAISTPEAWDSTHWDQVDPIQDQIDDVRNTLIHKADLIYDTASGDIASFPDGADGLPAKDLTVGIEPAQDLHGYENPWPAGGGNNLLNPNDYVLRSGYDVPNVSESNGVITISNSDTGGRFVSFLIPVETGETYSLKADSASGTVNGSVYFEQNKPESYAEQTSATLGLVNGVTITATAPWMVVEIISQIDITITKLRCSKGSSALPYAPYSNICPISGWTGCNVTRTGFNVWDEEWELGAIDSSTGQNSSSSVKIRSKNYIPIFPETSYFFKANDVSSSITIPARFYDANKNYIGYVDYSGNSLNYNRAFKTPTNAYFMRFNMQTSYGVTYNNNICINISDPAKNGTYEPGHVVTIPISWQSEAGTVYGGTLDVTSGVLTSDMAIAEFNGSEDWFLNGQSATSYRFTTTVPSLITVSNTDDNVRVICSNMQGTSAVDAFDNAAAPYRIAAISNHRIYITMPTSIDNVTKLQAWLSNNPMTVAFNLDAPNVYQLTPTEVTTLLGQNNILADCGPSTVEYPADTKLYIQKINTPTDDDMIADANIASGQYFIVNNNLYISTAAILAGDPIKPGTNCTLTNLAAALNALNS